MIDRSRFKSKLISFELSLGNAGNRQFLHSQCTEQSGPSGAPEIFILLGHIRSFIRKYRYTVLNGCAPASEKREFLDTPFQMIDIFLLFFPSHFRKHHRSRLATGWLSGIKRLCVRKQGNRSDYIEIEDSRIERDALPLDWIKCTDTGRHLILSLPPPRYRI